MIKYFSILLLFFAVLFSGCVQQKKELAPKYVFLFIGDGMGLAQIQSAEMLNASLNKSNNMLDPMVFSDFPVQSLVTTYSANSSITCSSAAGTAISTGVKTNNGMLCKHPETKESIKTIAEKLKEKGFKIGVVSSVAIDHATPAAFYAHQDSRSMYYEISTELPKSNFDYFGGGGFHYPTGKKKDKANVYDIAKEAGYSLIQTVDDFKALKPGVEKVFAMNPELYPQGEFYWAIDKKEGALSLADFTEKGIELLKNDKGFFMMVEGGKIDWAGHGNDAASNIHETLEFNKAVAKALDFYKQYPEETLILVTADHETGGMSIGVSQSGKNINMDVLAKQNISSQEFERLLVQLKKENPNVSFEEVMALITEHFGLENGEELFALTVQQKDWLRAAYKNEFKGDASINPDADYLTAGEEKGLTGRVVHLMNQKAGIGWTSTNHTAISVPLRAIGPGSEKFSGIIDNTEISKHIMSLMEN